MREYISHIDVANTVMMLRSGFHGTVVLLEGKTDDRLYGKFLDRDKTTTVVAQSKSNVCKTLSELMNRGDSKVIGIVDTDVDAANGTKRDPPLFYTDGRDLEVMLFFSDALDSLLSEYADRESLRRFTDSHGTLRDTVCEGCYYLGLLMLVSQENTFGLNFKDIDFEKFIDKRSLRCDVRKMIDIILSNSHTDATAEKLMTLLNSKERYPYDWICRGHDVVEVLAIGLRNIFGIYNAKTITGNVVSGGLRMSFSADDMKSTNLYSATFEWASSRGLGLWRI